MTTAGNPTYELSVRPFRLVQAALCVRTRFGLLIYSLIYIE